MNHSKVAIVGISLELPSPPGTKGNLVYDSLYEYLLNKRESYTKIPPDRFNIDAWKGNNLGQISTERGTFLQDIDHFANVDFGVSTKDARAMAPSTRKLIEHSFKALYDSGIEYRGRNVGCFTAGTIHDITLVSEPNEFDAEGSFAGAPSMIANRISYHLDLRGPSIPSDTACSSSATALHLAINALLRGDCEAAVVGGCQLNHQFIDWFNYSQGRLLSKDGKCKPFDASADGFSRGEGVISIVIKPLEFALRDNDHIYGVILGTAVNATGSAAPPNAPVASAQEEALIKAFQRAGRSPNDVAYVECHATGTAKGDPTEANWIGKICSESHLGPLWIGSIKGNMGHTEIASFLASLAKVLLILQHSTIPPNVNMNIPNPSIEWEKYSLQVPREPERLPIGSNGKSLISICSSGIGGSNAHVVMENFVSSSACASALPKSGHHFILAVGGLSPQAVTSLAGTVLQLARESSTELSYLAVEAIRKARQMPWRSYIVADYTSIHTVKFPDPVLVPKHRPHVVFLFSGQGPQYWDMGRQLCRYPAFRQSILESDQVYERIVGQSLIKDHHLFDETKWSDRDKDWTVAITLPALTIFQMAVFDLLRSIGVIPGTVMGHSAGETSVLYASGAGSKAMTIALSIARANTFSNVEIGGKGGMAVLACNETQAKALFDAACLDDTECIDIACYNADSAVAISGSDRAMDKILTVAQEQNIWGQKLRTKVPVHSSMMELCKEEYLTRVKKVFLDFPGIHSPTIPTISSTTGNYLYSEFTADYFWKNARQPVLFTHALESLSREHPDAIIMEISPHPVLGAYVSQKFTHSNSSVPLARRHKTNQSPLEMVTFLNGLGTLLVAGQNSTDLSHLYPANPHLKSHLRAIYPDYPLNSRPFPIYPDSPGYRKQMTAHAGPLNHKYLQINEDTHPLLAQHIIQGEAIMPASGFMEMALEFGASSLFLIDFKSILSMKSVQPTRVQIDYNDSHWSVVSTPSSFEKYNETETIVHATGIISFEKVPAGIPINLSAIQDRCDSICAEDFYLSLGSAFNYGKAFQRVVEVHYNRVEALAKIRGMDEELLQDADYIFHPAILDACFHTACFRGFHANLDSNAYLLPGKVASVLLHQKSCRDSMPKMVYAYLQLTRWRPENVLYDIDITDESGHPLCSLHGFEFNRHYLHHLPKPSSRHKLSQQPLMLPEEAAKSAVLSRHSSSEVSNNSDIWIAALFRKYLDVLCRHKQFLNIFISGVHDSSQQNCILNVLHEHSHKATIAYYVHDGPLFSAEREAHSIYPCSVILETDGTPKVKPYSCDIALLVAGGQDIEAYAKLLQHVLVPHGLFLLLNQPAEGTPTEPVNAEEQITFHMLQQQGLAPCGYLLVSSEPYVYPLSWGYALSLTTSKRSKFNITTSHYYYYHTGAALDFRDYIADFEFAKPLDIWIVSRDGPDADEASGLVKVLRKEYPAWMLRFIVFPDSFKLSGMLNFLEEIPYYADELDIKISAKQEIWVPKITSHLISFNRPDTKKDLLHIPSLHVAVSILAGHYVSDMLCFVGHILESKAPHLLPGVTVAGISLHNPSKGVLIIDSASVISLPFLDLAPPALIAQLIPGLVVAALAPSLVLLRDKTYLSHAKVLLTHPTTPIGAVVCHVLNTGVGTLEIVDSKSVDCFAALEPSSYDLIISGHHAGIFPEIMKTLVKKDRGKLCIWPGETGILAKTLKHDPYLIGHAIKASASLLEAENRLQELWNIPFSSQSTIVNDATDTPNNVGDLFMSDLTYLLVGGAGSIGPHIALWLYQRGARHIILTSRSGISNLRQKSNVWALQVFQYLDTCPDLDIHIFECDATNQEEFKTKVLNQLEYPLGGCFLLSATKADGMFANLTANQIELVTSSSFGVFDAFCSVVDLNQLDFLFVFSSVSAMFGNAGQANYAMAKSKVDERIMLMENAISFICPPIEGTNLINSTQGGLSAWTHTIPEVIQWIEDAILQIKPKAHGQIYIPNMNWDKLSKILGPTDSISHLLPQKYEQSSALSGSTEPPQRLIQLVLDNHLDVPVAEFSTKVPLVSYGLDSLSASRLSFDLDREFSLKISQIQLLSNITMDDILHLLSQSQVGCNDSADSRISLSGPKLSAKLNEDFLGYIHGSSWYNDTSGRILARNPVGKNNQWSGDVVLLTGTTGTLGSHILYHLLHAPEVISIYVLIRGNEPPEQAQASAFHREGLKWEICQKLRFFNYNFSADKLGISKQDREMIGSNITHIIHCAWITNNHTAHLSVFDGLLKGTRSLLDLVVSYSQKTRPKFIFISTTGVCRFKKYSAAAAEEEIGFDDIAVLNELQMTDWSGYLQSKLIAERIVLDAGHKTSIDTAIIRVGQLTGGQNGSWSPSQWFPALVKSGLATKCLPAGDQLVSWLDSNTAAQAIVDLFSKVIGVAHIVHPHPSSWNAIMEPLAARQRVPLVPFDQWVHCLTQIHSQRMENSTMTQPKEQPALMLVDFFAQGLKANRSPMEAMGLDPVVSTVRSRALSKTLSNKGIPGLDEEVAAKWWRYWQLTGFIPITDL